MSRRIAAKDSRTIAEVWTSPAWSGFSERRVAPSDLAKLDKRGDGVEQTKVAVSEDTLQVMVDGRSVTVMTRQADDHEGRLYELDPSARWSDSSPLSDRDVETVVRGLIDSASKDGEVLEVVGVTPAAAQAFPDDPRITVSVVEPLSFTLPASPCALVLQMNERGDGKLYAFSGERVELGSDGMWWLVTQLIDALQSPDVVSNWPRFLTVGNKLGGRAAQATLEVDDAGVRIVWRLLESGVVGDAIALHELTPERVAGWLNLLRPVRDDL